MIPAPMERSRPAGRPCSRSRAEKLALFDSEADGRKRLEIRPPAAVEFGTLKKSEREDGQCSAWLVLSFRKGLETRNEQQSIKLSNDSNRQKSRLFHALRGLKDGVHLSDL